MGSLLSGRGPHGNDRDRLAAEGSEDDRRDARSRRSGLRGSHKPFAEAFPDLAARLRPVRGKQKAPTKELVSLRLDRDVLAAFRSTGPGWQARINAALRKAAPRTKPTVR
jgi:uncharacterized protein (DUF4415 family)